MVSSTRAASASSQDWKRAASVNSTGTPSSSIRREFGSSSRDGQPRHVEIVHPCGVAAGDPRIVVRGRLGLFVGRHPGKDSARIFRDWGNVDSLCG